jgi:hypothetical protein
MSTIFFFMLTEKNLMSYSADSLFLLLVEKIQTINLLDRLDLDKAYSGAKKEIKLIQKIIRIKEAVGKNET